MMRFSKGHGRHERGTRLGFVVLCAGALIVAGCKPRLELDSTTQSTPTGLTSLNYVLVQKQLEQLTPLYQQAQAVAKQRSENGGLGLTGESPLAPFFTEVTEEDVARVAISIQYHLLSAALEQLAKEVLEKEQAMTASRCWVQQPNIPESARVQDPVCVCQEKAAAEGAKAGGVYFALPDVATLGIQEPGPFEFLSEDLTKQGCERATGKSAGEMAPGACSCRTVSRAALDTAEFASVELRPANHVNYSLYCGQPWLLDNKTGQAFERPGVIDYRYSPISGASYAIISDYLGAERAEMSKRSVYLKQIACKKADAKVANDCDAAKKRWNDDPFNAQKMERCLSWQQADAKLTGFGQFGHCFCNVYSARYEENHKIDIDNGASLPVKIPRKLFEAFIAKSARADAQAGKPTQGLDQKCRDGRWLEIENIQALLGSKPDAKQVKGQSVREEFGDAIADEFASEFKEDVGDEFASEFGKADALTAEGKEEGAAAKGLADMELLPAHIRLLGIADVNSCFSQAAQKMAELQSAKLRAESDIETKLSAAGGYEKVKPWRAELKMLQPKFMSLLKGFPVEDTPTKRRYGPPSNFSHPDMYPKEYDPADIEAHHHRVSLRMDELRGLIYDNVTPEVEGLEKSVVDIEAEQNRVRPMYDKLGAQKRLLLQGANRWQYLLNDCAKQAEGATFEQCTERLVGPLSQGCELHNLLGTCSLDGRKGDSCPAAKGLSHEDWKTCVRKATEKPRQPDEFDQLRDALDRRQGKDPWDRYFDDARRRRDECLLRRGTRCF